MKNANLDKTVIFIDKNHKLKDKTKIAKLKRLSKLNCENKVIKYQERKKSIHKGLKKNKIINSRVYKLRKKILAISIGLLCVLLIFIACNNRKKALISSSDKATFAVQSQVLSSSDNSLYSSIIKDSIKNNLRIQYDVTVTQLHKNGPLVFANGYFYIPDKGNVYYDMILKSYKPYSIKVNGKEYINN